MGRRWWWRRWHGRSLLGARPAARQESAASSAQQARRGGRGGRRAEAGALAVAQLCTGSVGGGEGAAARLRCSHAMATLARARRER